MPDVLDNPALLQGSKWNVFVLPNFLTAGRFGLALVLFGLLAMIDRFADDDARHVMNVCFGLFLAAAVTDLLDGWVARRLGQVTAFGRMMDPFVDKVLVCGTLVLLCSSPFHRQGANLTGLAPWMTVVVLTREFLVTGLRSFSESRSTPFEAEYAGKVKMVLQSALVGWLLFALGNCRAPGADGPIEPWAYSLGVTLIVLTLIATVYSGLIYLDRARRLVRGESDPSGGPDR